MSVSSICIFVFFSKSQPVYHPPSLYGGGDDDDVSMMLSFSAISIVLLGDICIRLRTVLDVEAQDKGLDDDVLIFVSQGDFKQKSSFVV